MNLFDRIRRRLHGGTTPVAADPDDLHEDPPQDAGATTGLDRPFPAAGPVADLPVTDPPSAGPPERPLG